MPRSDALYDWSTRVANAFPNLPATYSRSLAEWSFGMAQAGSASCSGIAVFLAVYLTQSINTVRQRLRELYQPADAKAGTHRTAFDGSAVVLGLVRWITATWTDKRLALALDPTNFGDRFTVLTLALVYRGCGIPLAWIVVDATASPTGWNAHWKTLLARARAAIGDEWMVIVCGDRGLESKELFTAITALGWHPFLRVKAGGHFRPTHWTRFRAMGDYVSTHRPRFAARGTAYKTNPLDCTLLACLTDGCVHPWLILTDLPPSAADPGWYAFRSWIEQGFRIIKRGGWQWQRTRMTEPDRIERVWAALALATVWMVELGGLAEFEERAETVPPIRTPSRRTKPSPRPRSVRTHRLFTRGLAMFRACLLTDREPRGRWDQDDWPSRRPAPRIKESDIQTKK